MDCEVEPLKISPEQGEMLRAAWEKWKADPSLISAPVLTVTILDEPVTIEELRRRGLDSRLEALLNAAIGPVIKMPVDFAFTLHEVEALGYVDIGVQGGAEYQSRAEYHRLQAGGAGQPCQCGERGLSDGEACCAHPACCEPHPVRGTEAT
jgi:hypothetical protein